MGAVSDAKLAESFAENYEKAEGEHPDLESRVVMYRRAVESKDKRRIAAHARTLVRFARNTGRLDESEAEAEAEAAAGPTKAELKAQAEALGLPVSGSKADLEKRIAEHNAGDGDGS